LKRRFTQEQIAFALELIDTGMPVGRACRQFGMSEAALYGWRRKQGGTRRTYRRAAAARPTTDPGTTAPDTAGS
jgi:transposase-like protein